MGHKMTIRASDGLLAWLRERSRLYRVSISCVVRECLEAANAAQGKQQFLADVGEIKGCYPNLSTRKGSSRQEP